MENLPTLIHRACLTFAITHIFTNEVQGIFTDEAMAHLPSGIHMVSAEFVSLFKEGTTFEEV